MSAKSRVGEDYRPLQAKTLPALLSHWLAVEFPHLGGPKVRALFVAELLALIEHYYPPRERLRPGQTLWWAVDKTDLPQAHHTMAQTRLVPVVLTLVAADDIQALAHGTPRRQVTQQVIARLHTEADHQGGVLAEVDTGLLLAYSRGYISKFIRAYERRTGEIVPRRGTVHDMGASLTHKAVIARKVLCERKSTAQTAADTNHTPESVERYLRDLLRCYVCLKRAQQSPQQTAFATGLSVALVNEYAALIDELGLSDQNLPDTLAKVEATQTQRRKPRST
jgi:hypothetical protein